MKKAKLFKKKSIDGTVEQAIYDLSEPIEYQMVVNSDTGEQITPEEGLKLSIAALSGQEPPKTTTVTRTTNRILISAVAKNERGTPETFIFAMDENLNVLSWIEIRPGSLDGVQDVEAALVAAGFEVGDDEQVVH